MRVIPQKNILEILEDYHAVPVNAFFDAGDTFRVNVNHSTRVDYVFGPLEILDRIWHCGLSKILARKVQYIKDFSQFRDHLPLVVVIEVVPLVSIHAQTGRQMVRWDWGKLQMLWQFPAESRDKFVGSQTAGQRNAG